MSEMKPNVSKMIPRALTYEERDTLSIRGQHHALNVALTQAIERIGALRQVLASANTSGLSDSMCKNILRVVQDGLSDEGALCESGRYRQLGHIELAMFDVARAEGKLNLDDENNTYAD